MDDFEQRFQAQAADAHAVVRLLLEGMAELERDPERGERMIAIVCSKDQLSADGAKLRDREAIRRLLANPHIARSYVGASHTDGYAWNHTLAVTFDTQQKLQGVDYPEPGRAKLFVASGGADSPRPVELRKNASGQWKVTGWSSLQVGVRKPPAVAGDF